MSSKTKRKARLKEGEKMIQIALIPEHEQYIRGFAKALRDGRIKVGDTIRVA